MSKRRRIKAKRWYFRFVSPFRKMNWNSSHLLLLKVITFAQEWIKNNVTPPKAGSLAAEMNKRASEEEKVRLKIRYGSAYISSSRRPERNGKREELRRNAFALLD
jgi:hypothetical protein